MAVEELLGFDPRLLPQLPVATTALCRRTDGGGPVVLTTSKAVYEAARAAGWPVFAGGELASLTLAAEHERAWPSTLAEWCARKLAEPAWRLDVAVALGGLADHVQPRGWRLERLLRRLGLELEWVGAGDELPPTLAHSAQEAP